MLIDIPRLKNLPYLEPGTPVFVEDIEAWEKKANVKVGPAMRSSCAPAAGPAARSSAHGRRPERSRLSRVGRAVAEGARRLVPRQRRGAGRHAVAGEGINLPVHTLAITALGIDILDNQDLEAVAETAARLNRWEFLLTRAPVPVTGGTGFPVNPLAIF